MYGPHSRGMQGKPGVTENKEEARYESMKMMENVCLFILFF